MSAFIPAARPLIGEEERTAVDRVLQSGMMAQGPEVAAFENEFSTIVADRHCIAVNSGTSGLHMALVAVGIKQGDEVIVPSFTFAATANAVALTGATPVFVDIDPQTFNIDPLGIEAAITSRTRAIQPVHLYGQPAAMKEIMAIAASHNLLVIEDAAQAHMASLDGAPVGSFGTAGVFSFYPTKNMTSGEGGMISTASDEIARQCRLLRNQGMEKRYANEIVGFNTRMTDIHAAIGRVQLTKLTGWTTQRRTNAKFLDENLKGVAIPYVAPGAFHVYHQYTIRIIGHDRDAFAAEMTKRGVGNGVYYPIPVHKLQSFGLTFDLPETTRACKEVLSIPVHPALTQEDLETVVSVINSIAAAGA
ncbi:MAG TPA: DegT/DnrJ/EryC1/StrS family aminotransferase [Candidatus Paceibacterota bacterium]|nr:DegT/DnrJ/EryC1/StrS family aminotransferase [Candidatus Paceibacterota bacterium]